MATSGGFGLQVRIDVSSTQTAIANLMEGEIPEFEKFIVESTSHGAASGYATYQATGKRKLNEFKVKLGWDKTTATHTAVIAAFNSNSPVSMSVLAPDSSETISFSAHVTKLGRMAEQEDMYTCEVTIQPTGAPTVA
jgi:predicted secreted protein